MKRGFTLVEVLVVTVVIVLIASVSVLGYQGWREDTSNTVVTSDLQAAANAMENEINFSNAYPTSVPKSYTGRTAITITLRDSGKNFCLRGVGGSPAITLYWRSNEGSTRQTAC